MTTERDATQHLDPLRPHASSAAELRRLIGAERAATPFLAYRDNDERLVLLPLDDDHSPVTIGRRAETEVVLDWDGLVSGIHAELQHLGGEWTLVDDGLSTNGTFVNGERVAGRRRLRDADRIRVGRTIIAFSAAIAPQLAATVTDGERPLLPSLSEQQRRVLVALCRPYSERDRYATPATNQQIAGELFLSVDAVKMHLRALFGKFEMNELPQNQKRTTLAETALHFGIIGPRDF
jgi:pSer/pThr/pTyr-binding forkhead associated (FHA) protein